jgi:hypothetical protein
MSITLFRYTKRSPRFAPERSHMRAAEIIPTHDRPSGFTESVDDPLTIHPHFVLPNYRRIRSVPPYGRRTHNHIVFSTGHLLTFAFSFPRILLQRVYCWFPCRTTRLAGRVVPLHLSNSRCPDLELGTLSHDAQPAFCILTVTPTTMVARPYPVGTNLQRRSD